MPDLAAVEAQYEQMFAAALAMEDDREPVWTLAAWGGVLESATVLERVREIAEGEGTSAAGGEATDEAVLRRWQQLRPESGGPDLFRAFRNQEPAARRAAVLAVRDRYPDDLLVAWQAVSELRQAGADGRAAELAETFAARNPEHPQAYALLIHAAAGNQTRTADALRRWARAAPGDPALVRSWLGSGLADRDREATDRVLADFFARRPSGEASLSACLDALGRGGPSFNLPARACVARIAGDPELTAHARERATAAIASMATDDGDMPALMAALEQLEPSARFRALIGAANELKPPERCAEAMTLLSVASRAVVEDDDYRLVASALRGCSDLPAAQEMYLDLLRRAPAEKVASIVRSRMILANDVYRGELPAGTAGILEQRALAEPDAAGLFAALDLVYRVADPENRHFDLLRRWQRRAPDTFRGEQAAALAQELWERGSPGEAVEVLERQLGPRFEPALAEQLWELLLEEAGAERAERLAADLIATGDPWRVSTGHALAARSAVLRGDHTAAERHYWQALEGDHPQQDVALELLVLTSLASAAELEGGAGGAQTMALRLCRETRLATDASQVSKCAADLLSRAGSGDDAAALLAAHAAELPEDLSTLRELASSAHSAGMPEVAERAIRRILELDPQSEDGWVRLGNFLEHQRRVEELESLLESARELFSPPPSFLYRATARALTADRPRRAIDVLLEARGTLPESEGGAWSRTQIDLELRQAYRRLGERAGAAAVRTGPAPLPASGATEPPAMPEATARELRLAADALLTGSGGRYDPAAADELYSRAAALGDPLATFRLAITRRLGRTSSADGAPTAEELHRRSATAVAALATEGDATAQYLLGTAFLIGLGGREDAEAARRWLEPAAAQGVSWAWHNLAWMAETGRGLEAPDLAAALDGYRRASEAGNTRSMVDVARLTLILEGSGAPCEEGLRWLELAARSGNARAAAFLGKVLFYGRGDCVARSPGIARQWLEAGAATHQPGARYDLAMALLLTADEETDRARGAALLEEEASRADTLAIETLAFLHATGIAVPRDPARAGGLLAEAARLGSDGFQRLRRESGSSAVYRQLLDRGTRRLEALAAQADPPAMAFLARWYAVGLGGEADPERIFSLARSAAAAGEPMAMRVLSGAYRSGEGVDIDREEGLRWRRRCAEAGDSFCMMFHGNALIRGEALEKDPETGLRWLRRSAEAGNWWAVGDLGRLYTENWGGLPQDLDEAAVWRRRLADLGDPEATGWLLYHGYR